MEKTVIEKIQGFERFGSVLGLERMQVLMELLGNPQDTLRCLHVAGTNGKGSVCRFLYEGLRANGYKVGLFTSPFIEVFNERIEFDGAHISDADLASCTETVLAQVDVMLARGCDSPTEFEVVTAIAFLYFKEKGADFVVLEVGLGGRGDSTNIIKKPLLSIITSISYDHTDRLGKTLAEIAGEKAGIIKAGVPVVMNVKTEGREAEKVIARKAYEIGSVLHDVTKLRCGNERTDMDGTTFDASIYGTSYADVDISMLGSHQVQNALTALTALELLRKECIIKVRRDILYAGIKNARMIGRFELMRWTEGEYGEKKPPYVILDGAHNEAGAGAFADTVASRLPGKRLLIVCGILADKDSDKILDHFTDVCDDFIATEPASERRMPAAQLCGIIRNKGAYCTVCADPAQAVALALDKQAKEGYDAVLFTGSLYLLGKIRGILKDEQ